jgi:hypothetical protein
MAHDDGMIARMKASFERLKSFEPGTRFERQYREHKANKSSAWMRPLFIVAGIAMIAVGLAGLVLPGPGLLGLAIGFALLARESLVIAKAMDRAEVQGRKLWSRWRHRAA